MTQPAVLCEQIYNQFKAASKQIKSVLIEANMANPVIKHNIFTVHLNAHHSHNDHRA